MARHVDLVENRWSAGHQERVGKAYRSGEGIEVEAATNYRETVLGRSGPSGDPERFLEALSERFHSDYFFATKPHDDDECPFAGGDRVPFRQQSPAHPAGARR